MRESKYAIPQSATLMRGLILGEQYAKDAASEMAGRPLGVGRNASAALNDADATWEVEKRPAFHHHPKDGFMVTDNSYFVTRLDTDRPVTGHTVSGAYEPFQNRAMGEWAEQLVDLSGADHVGAVVLDGGAKVMLLVRLTPSQMAASVGDEVIPTLAVATGHDGGTSLSASTMAFRQVCSNTLHWSIPGLTRSVRIRHTKAMEVMAGEAQRALNLAETWSTGFDKELEKLLDVEVGFLRAEQLLETVFPTDEADEELKPRTRTNNIQAQNGILEARQLVDAAFRETGWGFMNAVTEWDQWMRSGTRTSGPERHLRAVAGSDGDGRATRFRNLVLAN